MAKKDTDMKEWLIDILKGVGIMIVSSAIIIAILIMAKYVPWLIVALIFVGGCVAFAYMIHDEREWQEYYRETNKRFREYLNKDING